MHCHASRAGRILPQLGWSCQRPVGRALERDEEGIQHRKKEHSPEVKKKPETNGERFAFTDESELSELRCLGYGPTVGRFQNLRVERRFGLARGRRVLDFVQPGCRFRRVAGPDALLSRARQNLTSR
ncbi:MAG: winged helix-turn-helix domain-containing protein [Terriglobales bacterium]